MAALASLIPAGIGLLSSVMGGGGGTPSFVKENYKLQTKLQKQALDLYLQTNLEEQDAQTIAAYSDGAMRQAMTMLGNYDAVRAGQSGRTTGSDTQTDRAHAQIAGDSANSVAQLAANLSSTRPQRKAALLPSAAGAAGGFQSAAYLDQAEANRQNGQDLGLMQLATSLAGLIKPKKAKTTTTGNNDLYNLNIPSVPAVA